MSHRTVTSAGLVPPLKISTAWLPSASRLSHTCCLVSASIRTRPAWMARTSWLIASISGAVRIRFVALLIVRGSLPSISGAASMHQNENCALCSV